MAILVVAPTHTAGYNKTPKPGLNKKTIDFFYYIIYNRIHYVYIKEK